MSAVTLGGSAPHFHEFEAWYRGRPTQWALAISLVLHALLIALVPGFRSVPPETPTVLTVQIMDTEPVVEKVVERKPVVRQPEQPLPLPEFAPTVPQPRVVEQQPVRPEQVIEPTPVPLVRQLEQPVIEPVARTEFLPAVPQNKPQIKPVELKRPDLLPDQPVVPVIEQPPLVKQVETPRVQPQVVRREPRVVEQQITSQVQPQPRPDVPQPVAAPTQVQQPVVATPLAPVPVPETVPVKRQALPRVTPVAPPVATANITPSAPAPVTQPVVIAAVPAPAPKTAAPVVSQTPAPAPAPVPQVAAPTPVPQVAAPAPKIVMPTVEPAVIEAYRLSVSQEVMRHMNYPRLAVARKWQGKTVVEMQVSPDGEVTDLAVAESSGREVLDEAAIAMVKRSLPLPKPPRGVRTVKVPVVFRLQG